MSVSNEKRPYRKRQRAGIIDIPSGEDLGHVGWRQVLAEERQVYDILAGMDFGRAINRLSSNSTGEIASSEARTGNDQRHCGMMQRRRGRIITIGSVAAFKGRTNGSIYATAKAGAMHFTRCLADQMRPFDVTVNTIAPGDTRTERFVATRAVDPARMAEAGTLDRIATVDEVARVVEFFAGPLGAFVSGQVVRVDGGGQAWPA